MEDTLSSIAAIPLPAALVKNLAEETSFPVNDASVEARTLPAIETTDMLAIALSRGRLFLFKWAARDRSAPILPLRARLSPITIWSSVEKSCALLLTISRNLYSSVTSLSLGSGKNKNFREHTRSAASGKGVIRRCRRTRAARQCARLIQRSLLWSCTLQSRPDTLQSPARCRIPP